MSCKIDESEGRNITKFDIPGSFMQAEMDELVHVKFEGIMADMLVNIDPELYKIYSVMEQGQLVNYTPLNKALYGNFRASLLFWRKLTDNIVKWGYKKTTMTGMFPIKQSRAVNIYYCGMLMTSKYNTCHRRCWKRRLLYSIMSSARRIH